MMTNCKTCGELLFDGKTTLGYEHVCPPKWLVWEEEEGVATEVFAPDEEAAAEKWAEMMDGPNDNFILKSGWDGVVVEVGESTSGPTKLFRVFAEPTVDYSAREEPA